MRLISLGRLKIYISRQPVLRGHLLLTSWLRVNVSYHFKDQRVSIWSITHSTSRSMNSLHSCRNITLILSRHSPNSTTETGTKKPKELVTSGTTSTNRI